MLNKFKVSTLTSMSLITVDISQVMLKSCFKVCDCGRDSVVNLTDCQEWRDMPLKLSRKSVRFRQESTNSSPRSVVNVEVPMLLALSPFQIAKGHACVLSYIALLKLKFAFTSHKV